VLRRVASRCLALVAVSALGGCSVGDSTTTIIHESPPPAQPKRPAPAPPNRLITFRADGTPESLGSLALQSADLSAAQQVFGPVTSIERPPMTCDAFWDTQGLEIYFQKLPNGNACGPAGRIQAVTVQGPAAEAAGWSAEPKGIRVGTSFQRMIRVFPRADRLPSGNCPGQNWELTTQPLAGGLGSLFAGTRSGKVSCLLVEVSAAGI
jgi:hypothetical protein